MTTLNRQLRIACFFLLAAMLTLFAWLIAGVCHAEETHTVTLSNGKTVKVVCEGDVCKIVNPSHDSILPLPPTASSDKPSDEPKMDQDDEIDSLRRDLREARKARIKSRGEYAELLEKAKAVSTAADVAARDAHGKESSLRTQATREDKLAADHEVEMQRAFEAAYRKAYAKLETDHTEEEHAAATQVAPKELPKAATKPADIDGVKAINLITDTTKDQSGTWSCPWCKYQEEILDYDKDFMSHYSPVFSRIENGSERAQQVYPERQVVNNRGQTVMSPGTPRWRLDTSSGHAYYRAGAMKIEDLKQWIKECLEAK